MGWNKKCVYCKKQDGRFRLKNKSDYILYTCIDCEPKHFEDIKNWGYGKK